MTKHKESVIAKLNELTQGKQSQWIEDARQREENAKLLRRSQLIALKILRKLRSNKEAGTAPSTQAQLAELLGVSPQQVNKWVKGDGNYTLDTIGKIEKVLNIELIHVPEPISHATLCTYRAAFNIYVEQFQSSKYMWKKLSKAQGKVISMGQQHVWGTDEHYAYN